MTPTHLTHKSVPRAPRPVAKQEVMARLFKRLIAFYGTKFADAFSGLSLDAVQEVWAEELGGYSLDEINAGVNACRQLKWPPTLPEFLNFCRPPLSPEAAYFEAVNNMGLRATGHSPAYSHPAVFWAAQEIGWWDMKNTPQRFIAARWNECLQRHLAKGEWASVPAPPPQLAAPQVREPNEAERAALAALCRRVGRAIARPTTEQSK